MTRSLDGEGKQRRRSEIVRAAVDVFAERGYFAARMREVAAKAGVADGTLYLYFKGKEDLLVSVLEEYAGEFLQRARRDVSAAADPVEQLRAVVERHLVSFENDRALAHVFQIELRHTRKFLREIAKGKVAEYLLLLQQVIANGVAKGVFRDDIPPDMAARAVFGALDELVTSWVLATRPKRLAPQAAPLVRLLLEGLQTQGRRG
ncbi:MAG: TetR/AcrR family transcriptional regulator [Acidobacteriota bacterium]